MGENFILKFPYELDTTNKQETRKIFKLWVKFNCHYFLWEPNLFVGYDNQEIVGVGGQLWQIILKEHKNSL